MRDVLMPVLSAALGTFGAGPRPDRNDGVWALRGDEFHQRNIASSALLMRYVAPHIARLEHDKQADSGRDGFSERHRSIFLNLAIPYCKAATDGRADSRRQVL